MKTLWRVSFLLVLGLLLSAGSFFRASAGPLIDGSTDFEKDALDAEVFWKVYSPHDATSPLGSIDYYSYFYQILNYAASTASINTLYLENPDHTPVVGVGFIEGDGLEPWQAYKNTAVNYLFYNFPFSGPPYTHTEIGPGAYSDWLYLTSNYEPGWVTGHLHNSTDATGSLPFPIPEPSTWLLLGYSIGGLLAFKRKNLYRKRESSNASL